MNAQFLRVSVALYLVLIAYADQLCADAITFSNTASISVRDNTFADPYPVAIEVSGIKGTVENFTLTLFGVTHSFSDDMSAVVVSPQGTAVLLFSGPGPNFTQRGGKSISLQTWTFDDNAAATLPEATTPTSGTYKPGLFEYDDNFPAPGPGSNYGFAFTPYLSEDLNGQWRLFVMDSNFGDSGTIGGGWSMTITFNPTAVPEPSTTAMLAFLLGATHIYRRARRQK